MIAFTRKTDYALLALAALAEAATRPSPSPLSARQIAETYRLSHPLVMNVLKDLLHGDIVQSRRGAKGGYELLRDPAGITVQEVLVAIEGQPALAACCTDLTVDDSSDCEIGQRCPITHSVQRLNDRIQGFLGEITLADLVNDSPSAGTRAPQVVPLSALRSSAKGAS